MPNGGKLRSGRRGPDPNMIKKRHEVTVETVVDLLNEILRIDKYAVSDLVSERVTVNKELAEHPTIQCVETGKKRYEMGLLGFLNGLFGIDEKGFGAIEAVIDEKRKTVSEFRVREPWQGVMGPDKAA